MERGTPRNIHVYNPTPNSMNVRWEPAPGPVQQYRINYASLSGPRPSESVSNLAFILLVKCVLRILFPSMSVKNNSKLRPTVCPGVSLLKAQCL